MSNLLRSPLSEAIQNPLRGPLASDTDPLEGGSFSSAFSAAFDLDTVRYEFTTAFSSAFAIFQNKKEFTSAFSNAFTNDNI